MDEQRYAAYLNLIQKLLKSSEGEELGILNAHQNLIDAGLLETMKQVAVILTERGDRDNSTFLRNVAAALSSTIGSPSVAETPVELLLMVLQAVHNHEADPEVVYPILQANQKQLNENFTQILKAWVTAKLTEGVLVPAQMLATDICNFSNLISQFSLGNKAINLEIAIAGYEVSQTVFTPEAFPQEWAWLQNNLGVAYLERIRGDKAINLELAIAAFQAALQICNQKAFPKDWAKYQNHLGAAYITRIRGDKAKNLELGIAACQAALQVFTQETFPYEWAGVQSNLALAYCNRLKGEKAENVELAIVACQAALQVYTLEAFPQEWATTQDNLGKSYRNRIREDKAENIELAIAAHQAALQVYTLEAFPKNAPKTTPATAESLRETTSIVVLPQSHLPTQFKFWKL